MGVGRVTTGRASRNRFGAYAPGPRVQGGLGCRVGYGGGGGGGGGSFASPGWCGWSVKSNGRKAGGRALGERMTKEKEK